MAELEEPRKCTSKTFKKGQKDQECGTALLIVKPIGGSGRETVWICPDCDSLELMPKSMRERIFEQ